MRGSDYFDKMSRIICARWRKERQLEAGRVSGNDGAADMKATLFSRYNRVMRGVFVGVLLIAFALVCLQFKLTLAAEQTSLAQRMQEQVVAIDALVESSVDAVNSMRIEAQTWYRLHPAGAPPSDLRQALRPCPDAGRVCLDQLPPPWTTLDTGNLTGVVGESSPGFERELAMALSLNSTFKTIKATQPGVAWAYYVSARRFVNLYPWVPSQSYFFDDLLLQKELFKGVEPERDPDRSILWTPAYVDDAGKGVMVTASAGVYGDGRFRGVVALDLTLGWLNQFVRSWHAGPAIVFIVNDKGQLIAHPTLVHRGQRTVLPVWAAFPESMRGSLSSTLDESRNQITLRNGYYVETLTIHNAPFRLVLLVPMWELVCAALQNGIPLALLLLAGLTVMMVLASRTAYRDAIAPAQKLVRFIQDEASGSGKSIPEVPEEWRPWFRTIETVFKAHADLVSIQQELDVARRMQQSIVPTKFSSRSDVEIYARMNPAKEVGGDFYDYFWLSETKIGVVIADVSGKGVPAALFMAVARTLLRGIAPTVAGPGACIALVNNLLAEDNEETMFVTLFYGILDVCSGLLTYANGGHNRPCVVDLGGTVSRLPGLGGIALGVVKDVSYTEGRTVLDPGSTLLLYTDGITEAFNPASEGFGEERLDEVLATFAKGSVEALLSHLVGAVHEFAQGAPQSDDITCLAIRYTGSAKTARQPRELVDELSPVRPDIDGLVGKTTSFLKSHGLHGELVSCFATALDEVISNIAKYSAATSLIRVKVWVTCGGVRIEVMDNGTQFDPTQQPSPDTTSDIPTRRVGGLGLYLVKSLMDSVSYHRDKKWNVVSFEKRVKRPENSSCLERI